jgi:hypothetical protein
VPERVPADVRAEFGSDRCGLDVLLADAFLPVRFLRVGVRKHPSLGRCRTLPFPVQRLSQLAQLFELTPFGVDAILICLAPELDLRYERVYAYLQDDVTRRRPSVDLVLNLLCSSFEEKLIRLENFAANASLIRHLLLRMFEDPSQQQPALLGKY